MEAVRNKQIFLLREKINKAKQIVKATSNCTYSFFIFIEFSVFCAFFQTLSPNSMLRPCIKLVLE